MRENRWKRPWLAAVLGLWAGTGHLYLHRWWRAAAWASAMIMAVTLFVPSSSQTALVGLVLTGSGRLPLAELSPLIIVSAVSSVDAYVLARQNNRRVVADTMGIYPCQACGHTITPDPDLSFCPWCATRVPESTVSHEE